MLKSFHTGSLGCAPTPSQYFARDRSRAISLYGRALAFSSYRLVGRFGIGLKVPMTSRGFAPRADLESESQLEAILEIGKPSTYSIRCNSLSEPDGLN